MAYRLHIGNKNYSSWSMRPWVLMTALDLAFEEKLTPFDGSGRQIAFEAFSPSGRVPCLEDEDCIVWESLAIAEYLAERHPGVWPGDRRARAWARAAAAEMHAGFAALRDECSMNCSLVIALGDTGPALQRDLARIDALWNDGLSRFRGPWLAGTHFTAVDAFYAPVAVRLYGYGIVLGETAMRYAERLWQMPAVSAWVQAGRREPWIDEPHESDCLRNRSLLADHRQGR